MRARAALLTALAVAGPATAEAPPQVAPGLWRTTTETVDSVLGGLPPQTAEACIVAPRHPLPPPPGGVLDPTCVGTALSAPGGGYGFERSCEAGGATHAQSGRLVGDPARAYTLTVVTHTTYRGPARPRVVETTVTAERLGGCEG